MRRFIAGGVVLIMVAMTQNVIASDSTFLVRIPSTIYGTSGLLLTQSINTLAPGKPNVGLGFSIGDDDRPDFREAQLFATATMGLKHNLEVSGQIPYFADTDRRKNKSESEIGDINLSLKWRFMDPSADFNMPGFGLSFTVFLPTGEPELGAGNIDSFGLKVLAIASAEADIELPTKIILFGFYANGGIYVQDSGDATEEEHGIVDLGILVPINKSRTLQFLLEGNMRLGRETRSFQTSITNNGDYVAILPGFRYITNQIALTGGWQHRFNEGANDDTDMLIFNGNYSFQ